MEQIQWDESFSVGVAQMDREHKRIIEMINLLLRDPEADTSSETVSEILTRITKYAGEHFATEEEILERHGYPELSSHKEKHRAFRKKAVAFCLDTMDGQISVPADALYYLKEWWTQHILTVDMRLSSFYKERGIT
ncbi:MAG: hemerythrin family protein [Deltaproteobacteria bacterium]|nr:hemerythrin family protein [Deltaproteobacteria bacterium]